MKHGSVKVGMDSEQRSEVKDACLGLFNFVVWIRKIDRRFRWVGDGLVQWPCRLVGSQAEFAYERALVRPLRRLRRR